MFDGHGLDDNHPLERWGHPHENSRPKPGVEVDHESDIRGWAVHGSGWVVDGVPRKNMNKQGIDI